MTSQFTTTNLVGNRVLVKGTDVNSIVGQTILDSTQFIELKGDTAHKVAHEAFDKAVQKFYAPLTKAAEALEEAHKNQGKDDIFIEVVQAAVEPTLGTPEIRVILTPDTVILRRIEAGDTDSLIWVGDSLEIAA